MARDNSESFTDYFYRVSGGYASTASWAGDRLFPELNWSHNTLKRVGRHMILEGNLVNYPKVYTVESLQKIREQGGKVKGLAEQSIEAIANSFSIAEHFYTPAQNCLANLVGIDNQILQYQAMLASEIQYEIDTRESEVGKVPDMLLRFKGEHYFIINVDYNGQCEEVIPVENEELEELLADEELPVMSLSNVSDYLQEEFIVTVAAKGFGEFTYAQARNYERSGNQEAPEPTTSPDSE